MKKYRNKSNLDIVKSYLNSERPFVTVGYTPKTVTHKEGEEWVDSRGQRWRQTKSGKETVNQQAEMIRKLTKQKCSCGQDIRYGNKLDEKFFLKTGKCFECIIAEETRLRVLGVFPFYEKYKLLSNYLGFLEDMKQKIEDSIRYFQTEGDTINIVCNGEGFMEKFKGLNAEELLKSAQKDLKEIIVTMEEVAKNKAKAKKVYDSETARAIKRVTSKK